MKGNTMGYLGLKIHEQRLSLGGNWGALSNFSAPIYFIFMSFMKRTVIE